MTPVPLPRQTAALCKKFASDAPFPHYLDYHYVGLRFTVRLHQLFSGLIFFLITSLAQDVICSKELDCLPWTRQAADMREANRDLAHYCARLLIPDSPIVCAALTSRLQLKLPIFANRESAPFGRYRMSLQSYFGSSSESYYRKMGAKRSF